MGFRKLGICGFALALFGLMVSYNNCSGFNASQFASNNSSSTGNGGGDLGAPGGSQGPVGFALAPISMANMKLAESTTMAGSITANNSFSGTVNLSIDRGPLAQRDLEGDIQITIDPAQVTLTPGQTENFTVTVTTQSMAPSFDFSNANLIATDSSGSFADVSTAVSMKVDAVFEIRMLGDDPDPANRWDRPATPINFRNHANGLKIRFVNYDTADTHIVHGNGTIPHQNVGQPLQAAPAPGQPGQAYEVDVAAGTTNPGSFYYHDIESGADRRDMNFGVNSSAAATAIMAKASEEQARKIASAKPTVRKKCHDDVGTDEP